jgi:predicted Kef-type K+ transport protein
MMGMIGWLLAGVGFLLAGIAAGQYGSVSVGTNTEAYPYPNYFGWSEIGFILIGVGLFLVGISKLLKALEERKKD